MTDYLDQQITKTRLIAAPVAKVWTQWTTHEGLRSWFGKDNTIQLMPNGAFEIYFLMDNPLGLRGSEGCKVLSFLPEKMLSFSWNAPPEFAAARNSTHQTWVVVTFEAIEEAQTRVTIHHLGWIDAPEWKGVFEYFDHAWDIVLNWLQERNTLYC